MTEPSYTIKQAAEIYHVSSETIRAWSKEFAAFLSPLATPEKGRQRLFNAEDMQVFDLIANFKKQGKLYEDIHLSLQQGDRGAVPEALPDEVGLMIGVNNERKLALQLNQMQMQVERLRQEVEATHEEVERLRPFEKEVERSRVKIEMLEAQIEQMKAEFVNQLEDAETKAELRGRLAGELESLKQLLKNQEKRD